MRILDLLWTLLSGGQENVEDFDTPPESPDDLRIELSPEVQAELDELETTEDFITKNQESIARSAGSNTITLYSLCLLVTTDGFVIDVR